MSESRKIFTPIKIGKMVVKNRIETAPAMPFLASSHGDVTRELIEWEKAYAKGGAGIVTIGDSPVSDELASHVGHILNLGNDKTVNELSKLAEAIQRYGARASIELTYLDFRTIRTPNDLTLQDIKTLIDYFAKAAYRCLAAGMDMIMIHAAHGHLISQFLPSKKNHRTDAYGGSFQNRVRFMNELLSAVRDKVGDRLAIEYRISADELYPDGVHLEEQIEFAKTIQDKIDLAHISVGNLFQPELSSLMIQPTYVERGINVHFAERYKQELKIPVTALGSINMEMAERIIAENKADMVAMNRALIADPESVNKFRNGQAEEIRPCVRCNTCINRTHSFFLPIRCAVNPLNGREAEFSNPPALQKSKKVVVIGGGPAGMEVARRAADRGHRVVLFEKSSQLGGALNQASALPFKADMRDYLKWSIHSTLHTPNLTVKLSSEATAESVKAENPDVIIIAVGSEPIIPEIPGINRQNVVWAGDVDLGKANTGNKVIIAGAGLTGSETALALAQKGKQVILIDMLTLQQIKSQAPLVSLDTVWDRLAKLKVEIRTGVRLEAVTETGVIVEQGQSRTEIACDTIVLALGMKPRREIVQSLQDLAAEVHVIGDCNHERGNLHNAVQESFFAAMVI